MGWTGVTMGFGIVVAVLGVIGIVTGLGIAVVGPQAMDDDACCQDEGGFLGLGGDSNADERRADDRNEVRAGGGMVAGIGAALLLVGAVLYATGRSFHEDGGDQQQQQTVEIHS